LAGNTKLINCLLFAWLRQNILLDGDGIVKLSDLGVSKMLQSSLDSAKTITGTPQYM
jgi:serine/threonine protein kinase